MLLFMVHVVPNMCASFFCGIQKILWRMCQLFCTCSNNQWGPKDQVVWSNIIKYLFCVPQIIKKIIQVCNDIRVSKQRQNSHFWVNKTFKSISNTTVFIIWTLDNLPAPHKPDGRRPVCIQSLFILCSSLRAVIETSWVFSPNSNMWANRGMYRHGSIDRNIQICNQRLDKNLRT